MWRHTLCKVIMKMINHLSLLLATVHWVHSGGSGHFQSTQRKLPTQCSSWIPRAWTPSVLITHLSLFLQLHCGLSFLFSQVQKGNWGYGSPTWIPGAGSHSGVHINHLQGGGHCVCVYGCVCVCLSFSLLPAAESKSL